jgi:putative lipoprotein (rSAM/lipoprotein system)
MFGGGSMNFKKNTTGNVLFRILKLTSLGLSSILGLFCNPGSIGPMYGVVAEYGMPWADYKVSGTIHASDTRSVLSGIRVSLKDTTAGSCPIDTVYTDSVGKYAMTFSHAPWNNTWVLHAEDIDSAANGSYSAKDTIITIPDSTLDSASGSWYLGHGEKNVDLDLDVN